MADDHSSHSGNVAIVAVVVLVVTAIIALYLFFSPSGNNPVETEGPDVGVEVNPPSNGGGSAQ